MQTCEKLFLLNYLKNEWFDGAKLNIERCDFIVATNGDNKILIVGGHNFNRDSEDSTDPLKKNFLTSIEEYSAETG